MSQHRKRRREQDANDVRTDARTHRDAWMFMRLTQACREQCRIHHLFEDTMFVRAIQKYIEKDGIPALEEFSACLPVIDTDASDSNKLHQPVPRSLFVRNFLRHASSMLRPALAQMLSMGYCVVSTKSLDEDNNDEEREDISVGDRVQRLLKENQREERNEQKQHLLVGQLFPWVLDGEKVAEQRQEEEDEENENTEEDTDDKESPAHKKEDMEEEVEESAVSKRPSQILPHPTPSTSLSIQESNRTNILPSLTGGNSSTTLFSHIVDPVDGDFCDGDLTCVHVMTPEQYAILSTERTTFLRVPFGETGSQRRMPALLAGGSSTSPALERTLREMSHPSTEQWELYVLGLTPFAQPYTRQSDDRRRSSSGEESDPRVVQRATVELPSNCDQLRQNMNWLPCPVDHVVISVEDVPTAYGPTSPFSASADAIYKVGLLEHLALVQQHRMAFPIILTSTDPPRTDTDPEVALQKLRGVTGAVDPASSAINSLMHPLLTPAATVGWNAPSALPSLTGASSSSSSSSFTVPMGAAHAPPPPPVGMMPVSVQNTTYTAGGSATSTQAQSTESLVAGYLSRAMQNARPAVPSAAGGIDHDYLGGIGRHVSGPLLPSEMARQQTAQTAQADYLATGGGGMPRWVFDKANGRFDTTGGMDLSNPYVMPSFNRLFTNLPAGTKSTPVPADGMKYDLTAYKESVLATLCSSMGVNPYVVFSMHAQNRGPSYSINEQDIANKNHWRRWCAQLLSDIFASVYRERYLRAIMLHLAGLRQDVSADIPLTEEDIRVDIRFEDHLPGGLPCKVPQRGDAAAGGQVRALTAEDIHDTFMYFRKRILQQPSETASSPQHKQSDKPTTGNDDDDDDDDANDENEHNEQEQEDGLQVAENVLRESYFYDGHLFVTPHLFHVACYLFAQNCVYFEASLLNLDGTKYSSVAQDNASPRPAEATGTSLTAAPKPLRPTPSHP